MLNQTGEFNFIEKGEYLDFYLYKNISMGREVSPKNKDLSPSSQTVIPTSHSKS